MGKHSHYHHSRKWRYLSFLLPYIAPTSFRKLILCQLCCIGCIIYGFYTLGFYIGFWPQMGSSESFRDHLLFHYPKIDNDASLITWDHAINTLDALENSIKDESMCIEVDIMFGKYESKDTVVVGHPPMSFHDLTLEKWLSIFGNTRKVLKLDFKMLEAVDPGLELVASRKLLYPVIVNADILPGPNGKNWAPVHSDKFLKTFHKHNPGPWLLSVGWTTGYPLPHGGRGYSWNDVYSMYVLIKSYQTQYYPHNVFLPFDVTFPVSCSLLGFNSISKLVWLSTSLGGSLTLFAFRTEVAHLAAVATLLNIMPKTKVFLDLEDKLDAPGKRELARILLNAQTTRDYSDNIGLHNFFKPNEWVVSKSDSDIAVGADGGFLFSGSSVSLVSSSTVSPGVGRRPRLDGRLQFWRQDSSNNMPVGNIKILLISDGTPFVTFQITSSGDLSGFSKDNPTPQHASATPSGSNAFNFGLQVSDTRVLLSIDFLDKFDQQDVTPIGKTTTIVIHMSQEIKVPYRFKVEAHCNSAEDMGTFDQLVVQY